MDGMRFGRTGLLTVVLLSLFPSHICRAGEVAPRKPAREVFERRAVDDGVTMVLVYYDMEGVSGQKILTSIDFPRPEYFEARELLTNDVNAVIDGLFAGGADSVYVVDAHGSFNPEPDILLDKMDRRARMLYRSEKFDPYVDLTVDNRFDAIVAVAMHSKTGGGGFADHTINVGADWILNGMSISESELLAYSWGRIGIPLVLVSGDDKLAGQLSWMDWLEYVTVKEAKGIDDALLYPVERCHEELRAAAKRSIENLDGMKSVRLVEPITATLRVVPPADLSVLARVPGIAYEDQSVTFTAADFQATYDGMRGLLDVAQSGYYAIAAGLLLNQGEEAFTQFKDALFEAWKRGASNEPETAEPASPRPKKLYFGSR